jgi:hypothetical protein
MRGTDFLTLYDAGSRDAWSPMFVLRPGWMAVIRAFGFGRERVWPNPGGRSVIQAACLSQVILRAADVPAVADGCGFTALSPDSYGDVLAEGPVVHDGCQVAVSACDSIVGLEWPGIYRLTLNDPDALGTVQVFMEAYPRHALGINP